MRKISQTVCALAILGMLSTTVASADQALTVAATTPATTASSTSTVAPGATEVAQAGPLSDVPLNSWAYDAVNQLAKDGIIKGYPDGTFKGNRPMTRYEAAVLAYRAVDMIEAQITAGKAVEKADMDAANKLMAAYGAELKAVERHVDALQKQADTTDKNLASTTALGAATAATVRKQQIHLTTWYRAGAYGQQINANAGPLPETVNGVVYAPGSALPGGIGTPPTGVSVVGSSTSPAGIVTNSSGPAGGMAWGPQPMYVMGQNGNTTGGYGHGLGMEYTSLSFGGNPDDRSQYLVKLTNLDRYSATNFYPQATPSLCTTNVVGVAGAGCSGANTSALDTDGILNNFVRLQDMWYQYTSPGGIAVKIGKFVQDAGARQTGATQWGLDDYVNGARIEYRNSHLNVQAGYGFEDTAAQNNLLYGIPASSITMWGEADYMVTKQINVGVQWSNYSGYHSSIFDSSAVICQGTGVVAPGSPAGTVAVTRGTSKILPLVAGQTFTAGGCGAGYQPLVYGAPGAAAGLPITGAYIDGTSLTTAPGAQTPHSSNIGAFVVGNFGQFHIVAEGDARQGNDPTTGVKWLGNLSGMLEADYGPYTQAPGVKGKWSLNMVAFAAQMNALGPGFDFYQSPNQWVQYSTNFSDYYYASIGVKRFITDTAYIGVWYMNMGLLPGTTIPASTPQCPGCVISGDSRNGIFTEFNLAF